jgi:hypothetical protein
MKIYYKNHIGKKINLTKPPFSLIYDELFDYSYDYEVLSGGSYGQYIDRFYKKVKTIPLKFSVLSKAENFNRTLRNFYEIIDADVTAQKPGRLELDTGEYMEGYIYASEKTFYKSLMPAIANELTFVTERPYWCRDVNYHFEVGPDPSDPITDPTPSEWLDFYDAEGQKGNFDYPFDFKRGTGVQTVRTDTIMGGKGSDFEMIIYGLPGSPACPVISIGGHSYIVNETVYPAEKMIINSREKTVIKVLADGTEVNCFAKRNKASSVFALIETGAWVVETNSVFDLTLYQERSEPRWNL